MKKRPSFKVAAIESLETRELLSTAGFRPSQLRASYAASTNGANPSVSVGSGTAGSSTVRVQGGPSATFYAQRRANLLAAEAAHPRMKTMPRQYATIGNRSARQAPTLATTPAPVSSTPTKLAPSLPFTPPPTGSSEAGRSFQMNPSVSFRPTSTGLNNSAIAVQPTVHTPTNVLTVSGPSVATSTNADPTSASSTTTLGASAVASYKVAVDNFAAAYSSGVNPTTDKIALTALTSSLALIGGTSWPINPVLTSTAASVFQTSVNSFVQSYTGGANPSADALAWTGLTTALGLFSNVSTTTPATAASGATTGSSPTIVNSTASTSANLVSPVITGLLSGIVSTGPLSVDSVSALRNAFDNFAAGYTSGTNTSVDKVAVTSLVKTLASIAQGQWSKAILATPLAAGSTTNVITVTNSPNTAATTVSVSTPSVVAATTPATTVSTPVAVTTPTNGVSTPVAVTTPTTAAATGSTTTATSLQAVATAIPTTTTSSSSTTAATNSTTTSTSSNSGVQFTAIRAPGV